MESRRAERAKESQLPVTVLNEKISNLLTIVQVVLNSRIEHVEDDGRQRR